MAELTIGRTSRMVNSPFEVPVSLGTVASLEQQTGVALISSHDQARDAVREAPVKNADETGWKQAGARRWLWTAATIRQRCSGSSAASRVRDRRAGLVRPD